MQEFFQRYLDKLDLTTVLENLLTKVISYPSILYS